ncbi:mannan endo-1,6-alpha-mannosidase [Exophiala viscosa]|uniref:Mannan endo-1,6-alpha-mannosidase n=1 Tax=Exophiala viscosa TaxID=2486360 RepID=A0AAN6I8V2_9EURO|nr:mannan endo-1,6-alpha-mannosidase [Exophiala viscosa]KAI1620772.1 mannan endo-1,6-alpha-mannosidase [Exophiala viscosa]
MHRSTLLLAVLLSYLTSNILAIVLNVEDSASVLAAAALAASGVQQLYSGNQNQTGDVLGKFSYPPYYWWESGGAWGGMVEYFHYTGDTSYVNITQQALISQLGPAYDFNNPNEAFDEGNDDQAFWVFAAMSAAEYSFPAPPTPVPAWLDVVQNAWQDYVTRWNTSTCNGGLKWQFHPENAGYSYKNSVSNGAFFQLSARLARVTGNQTYIDWANKIWDWCAGVGLIDDIYNVFDGTDETINCTGVDHHQWTYNVGVFLYGAAVLQNYTNASSPWVARTAGLLDSTNTFLTPFQNATDIMFEAECELDETCDTDQLSMKAYLTRWLAGTSIMAPFTAGRIGEILRASAQGAAAACTGGLNGTVCGSKWYLGGWDGTSGLGQELCAMEAMYALLVNQTNPPATLGNVSIQTAPVTSTLAATVTSLLPSASASARPLFDSAAPGGVKVQNKFRSIFAAIATTFAVY